MTAAADIGMAAVTWADAADDDCFYLTAEMHTAAGDGH